MSTTERNDIRDATGSMIAGSDAHAFADLRAGRLVDCDSVVRRLGGWQVMGGDPPGDASSSVASSPATMPRGGSGLIPLSWAASAATECERLHAILRTIGDEAATRFAAAMAAAMVRLMLEGPGPQQDGIAEFAVLPALVLRVHVTPDGMLVLGLRPMGSIT